jgi:hypothetical protein
MYMSSIDATRELDLCMPAKSVGGLLDEMAFV